MEAMMTADATDVALANEIDAARAKLVELASEQPSRWWTAYELKVEARNGWSPGAMGLALRQLIEEGRLVQRPEDLLVKLAG
jgi:hypothetical protein